MRLHNIFLFLLITHTDGLSVSISPNPVAVEAGGNVMVTSTITKTEFEPWKAFIFYVQNKEVTSACRGAAYSATDQCTDIFGCYLGFGFNCNYTHFNLLITNISTALIGTSIYAEVTSGSSSKSNSRSTMIQLKIPLTGVNLTPNGTLTMKERETQVFKCSGTSLPIASLNWNIVGSALPTSSPPLITANTISSEWTYIAQKNDNGRRILCTAVYESTSFSANVLLNILYIPSVSTSSRFNPLNIIENTTNVNMTCTVTSANPPVFSYRWYKDNTKIATAATFTIQRIHRSDSGRYSCDATNSIGTSGQSSQSEFFLNVLYGVTFSHIERQQPQEGSEFTVQCTGQSNPALSDNDIIWTKQNNNTFRQTGKQLVIKNINRLDNGHYICNAVITLSPSIESSVDVIGTTIVQVDVIYRPSVVIFPDYNPFNVAENTTDFRFTCTVIDSEPNVTSYRWYIDASVISSTAVYNIPTVKRSNAGMYTCDSTNIAGSSELSSPIILNVLYGVTVAPISKQHVSEGNELSITCNAQSNPAYTDNDVSWTKEHNTTFKQYGKRLLISYINRLDIGTYICIVKITLTPSTGQSIDVEGTTNVEIDVLFKPMMDGSKPTTKQLIAVPENVETYININLVANPVPFVQWISLQNIYMSGWCNNTIHSNDTFNGIYISSSILVPGGLGKYMFVSENSVGVFSQIISVVLNGKPKSPSIIYVFCKSTTATVLWVQYFNGGQLEVFRVVYWNNEGNLGTEISKEIEVNEQRPEIAYTAVGLKPNSNYTFYVVSINDYGNSSSKTLECSTDRSFTSSEKAAIKECSLVLESGIGMLAVGSVAVFAVTMCALYHCLLKKKFKSKSRSNQYDGIDLTKRVVSSKYDDLQEHGVSTQAQRDISLNTYEECATFSNQTSEITSEKEADSTIVEKRDSYEYSNI